MHISVLETLSGTPYRQYLFHRNGVPGRSGLLSPLLLYLIRRYRWRSFFPWPRFVNQTLFSHFFLFSITCTLRHRMYYDKQKAVAVVKHHYQGCQSNAKRA